MDSEENTYWKDNINKLFKKMCEIDHKKRINPDECLKEYNKLMHKYSHLSSKKGKKTKKKKLS